MRSIASMMSFTLLAATSRATRVVPEEDVHETAVLTSGSHAAIFVC